LLKSRLTVKTLTFASAASSSLVTVISTPVEPPRLFLCSNEAQCRQGTTAGGRSDPWREYLENLREKGMRQEMARLTLARKIAAVALTIWKKGETFDPKKLNATT
jgi:hypothetical protein